MTSFLQDLTQQIYQKHKENLSDLTLVFPNRRACLFFRKYLADHIEKPVWSPSVLSIEDFVNQLSSLQNLDKLSLIFKLYEIYKKLNPIDERFDRFFFWGEMLLKDFEDIDKYLVNAQNLFINVSRQKELDDTFDYLTEEQRKIILEFWSNFEENPSEQKKHFKRIWDILYAVYSQFKENLRVSNQAYSGMIFRDVVEQIQSDQFNHPFQQVIFAGFNALTKAEEIIIEWFITNTKAEIYWDVDTYYLKDKRQEAGLFFREYQNHKTLGKSFQNDFPSYFNDTSKNINIIGVPNEAAQAKVVGDQLQDLIEKHGNQQTFENTVVVLPEEHLLFPVLHSLPEDVSKINVTMGFPLKDTPLYSLFEHLLGLQQTLRLNSDGQILYNHNHVLSILKHPYIHHLEPALARTNIDLIEKENRIYLTIDDLQTDDKLFPMIFHQLKDPRDIFDYLTAILLFIRENGMNDEKYNRILEQEYVYHFYTQLNRLKEIVFEQDIAMGLEAFLRLFRQIIQSLRLPFTGEPLNGLQIMGVLETRNLDFENVFILSLNEGAFPASGKQRSFVPYNLRKAYDLPTYDQQDAIYAYLFYRLLQRAKNVRLIYNTENGLSAGGEMSRFLQQLIYESKHDIHRSTFDSEIKFGEPKKISIEKSSEVLRQLDRYLQKGTEENKQLTPSALNTYLDCRLKFYFRYVVDLYEPDEIEEEIDPRVFGNLLHHTMELLYQEFTERKGTMSIDPMDFEALRKLSAEVVEKAFKKQYGLEDSEKAFTFEGRNIIVREIIKKFAGKILEWDQLYAPFEIVGLETDRRDGYSIQIPIRRSDVAESVSLRGIIDRIDKKDDVVRVIDYKTGRDEKKVESIASLFDRDHDKRNKAAMQTFIYGLLYKTKYPNENVKVLPGIFNSKEMFGDDFDLRLFMREEKHYHAVDDIIPYLEEIHEHLTKLLTEVFGTDQPFDQTEDLKKCRNCPYRDICHR
ncbi:PD-(D/E)XK nuclease family protein [Fulvivirgaceae bacterium BMA10]|uniref:PD-(D/E)XK nuclease family protein n=1 Tax=Splendidivirga corallicola TaxID=3051826 RepID=A0ABT8KQG6_9BACT|nr:PD-(D/E)XK nuclease family protein [Fulvivirgaceae bacterium BMA10]